ncbi:MAG: hypothetical protein ABR604_03130, partial [Jatrophihabitantaceae bacterium]
MSIEDRIREAMTAHEHEAPSAAEFRAVRDGASSAPRRHTAWLAAATAACVVAIAVLVAVVASPRGERQRDAAAPGPDAAALACPKQYRAADPGRIWVPAQAQRVDGASRLVPKQTPAHVVLCAYLQGNRLPTTLSGSEELGGDLAAVTRTLTWLPRQLPKQSMPCTLDLRPTDGDAYLVGLTYPTGTVWVSAPGNHCEGASNGEFATTVNLLPWVAASYGAGAWVTDPPSKHDLSQLDPCWGTTPGRLGQESSLVPAEPTSAQICAVSYSTGKPAVRTVTTPAGLLKLVAALNAAPPRVSNSACQGDGQQDVAYELVFSYAEGPGVHVRVDPHCAPGIDNGSLQAFGSSSVVPLIQQVLAGH